MADKEVIKISVEEFSRIQRFMLLADKESDVYKAMYERYIDLKDILTSSGVNLTEIDRIKEQEAIEITLKDRIKAACDIAGISTTELGKKMGMSQSSISKRLSTGKFTQEEYEKMAEILGCKYISIFEFPDGQRV